MLGTILWLGGLSLVILVVLPSAQRQLEAGVYQKLATTVQTRLQSLGWFSLLIMVATGMFQMSASPNYRGFLVIDSTWAIAIITKHLVFGLMILVTAYLTWILGPALQRATLLMERKGEAGAVNLQRLQNQQKTLLSVDLFLGVVILALTALARVS